MPSVELESLTTKSRFVSIVATDIDGEGQVNGSAYPMVSQTLGQLCLAEGRIFGVGVVYDFATPLAAGASIDIGIAWPAGVTANIAFYGLCAGNALGYLYEGADLSGGTPATPVKHNRDSATASQAAVTVAPTVNSTGTLILKQLLIGGEGKKAGGSDVSGSNLILKPLTSYLVRLTNVNGTAHAAEVILEWTE